MSGQLAAVSEKVAAKRDKVFRIFALRSAVADAKGGDASGQETRTYEIDVSDDLEKRLGSLRTQLATACKTLNLQTPYPNPPQVEVKIDVTSASTIWALVDENLIWEKAQQRAFDACITKNLDLYAGKIFDAAREVLGNLNRYITLSAVTQTELPQEILDELAEELDTFATQANRHIENFVQRTGNEAGAEMVNFIRKQKNTEKAVIKYRGAKIGFVFMDSALIGGHIAHAAASFGATAPLAIIAIVRQSLDIATIVTKAVLKLDQMADYIEKELALIVKGYSGDAKSKAGNNIKETILGAVKGVLNLEVPSVDVCDTHIGDYEHKMRALAVSFNEAGFEIARVKKAMENYAALLNSADGQQFTPKQRKACTRLIDATEAAYLDISKRITGKEAALKTAADNVARWRGALSTLEKATSKWTKVVPKLASLVTGLGLGMGHIGGEHVETAAEISDRTLKLILEAVTELMEGINDYLLEKIGEAEEV